MDGIRDVHALVTGGGRGIGAAIARALAEAGARVTVTGRSEPALAATVAELRGDGLDAAFVVMDVSDDPSVDRSFTAATAQRGVIGILVNNAGQAAAGLVQDTSLETWNRVVAVNLTGTFLCSKRALPAMVAAGRGRIVNIASTAGLHGVPHVAAYSASKHGVIGLTRSLALEVARRGVTVNAVCPGYTASDMAEQAIESVMRGMDTSREEAERRITRASPLARLLSPEEVAGCVVWLCSDTAASITGETIVLGG